MAKSTDKPSMLEFGTHLHGISNIGNASSETGSRNEGEGSYLTMRFDIHAEVK